MKLTVKQLKGLIKEAVKEAVGEEGPVGPGESSGDEGLDAFHTLVELLQDTLPIGRAEEKYIRALKSNRMFNVDDEKVQEILNVDFPEYLQATKGMLGMGRTSEPVRIANSKLLRKIKDATDLSEKQKMGRMRPVDRYLTGNW